MTKLERYVEKRSKKSPEFAKRIRIENEGIYFALKMAQLRKDSGLTQKELARRTGKPQSTISRIETGEMNPSIELVLEILEAMGNKLYISFE